MRSNLCDSPTSPVPRVCGGRGTVTPRQAAIARLFGPFRPLHTDPDQPRRDRTNPFTPTIDSIGIFPRLPACGSRSKKLSVPKTVPVSNRRIQSIRRLCLDICGRAIRLLDDPCRISSDWADLISSEWDHRPEPLFDPERRVFFARRQAPGAERRCQHRRVISPG